jgi:hypothetical protein
VLALGALGVAAVVSAGRGDGGRPDPLAATAPDTTTTTPSRSTTTTASTTTVVVSPTDEFSIAAGSTGVVGSAGPLFTYTVEVEAGIPIDVDSFAQEVAVTLAEPRGWTATGTVRLQRVDAAVVPTFRIRLATPPTVDAHCAPLATNGTYSCRNGAEVMVNLTRWSEGAEPAELSLEQYRHYVISHEVGHALGHEHVDCPAPGALAPVMLQQTKGLQGCAPNPWPYPQH